MTLRLIARLRSLALHPRHTARLLFAMIATAGAQFGMLAALQVTLRTLFGGAAAQHVAAFCEKGAATCTVLLAAQGVVLAFARSLTELLSDSDEEPAHENDRNARS